MKGAKISLCRENRLRERKFTFKEESNLFSKEAKKNNKQNNNNMAFTRGGPERGNPAMTTKRLRQGEKETHNLMLWEKWQCPICHLAATHPHADGVDLSKSRKYNKNDIVIFGQMSPK